MTADGFAKVIRYLEGAFRDQLQPHERDAYWLSLAQDRDADVMQGAIAYVRSDRARYGFPKPGDLLDHSEPVQEPPYLIEGRENDRYFRRVSSAFRQITEAEKEPEGAA